MTQAARATAPKSFGRYEILDCLAESVMSHVYRVRQRFGGRDRILVLKTLHPHLMGDQKTRDLFFREIQTCMSLGHANIVQIHDFGEEQGSPYIVMEWVHGRHLRQVIEGVLAQTGRGIPLPLAVHFIEQTARGLHHAHTLKDKVTGEALPVVHRDLSPHNVLVSFDGTVKVIDFGLARPVARESETLSDQVWGKAGYLSPEQARGERLDRRSDIFSLGAVFWELLSGQKLFPGETAIASAEKIIIADMYVPRMVARLKGLPESLVQVMLKSMRMDRDARYSSAEEVARDLQAFLRSQQQNIEPETVVQFMSNVFKSGIDEERALLREYTATESRIRPIAAPTQATANSVSGNVRPEPGMNLGTLDESDVLPELAENSASELVLAPAPARGAAPSPIAVPEEAFHLNERVEVSLGARPQPKSLEELEARAVESGIRPVAAPQHAQAKPEAVGNGARVKAGIAIGLVALAVIGWRLADRFLLKSVADIDFQLSPTPDASTDLTLDGNPFTPNAAGAIPGVQLGRSHHLEVKRPNYLPFVQDFRFDRCGEWPQTPCSVQADLVPLVSGQLSLRTMPAATARLSNGTETFVHRTPFTQLALPPGDYQLHLEFDGGASKAVPVSVKTDQPANLYYTPEN